MTVQSLRANIQVGESLFLVRSNGAQLEVSGGPITPGAAFYQTVQDDGAALPQEAALNIVNGDLDDNPGASTDLTLHYQFMQTADGDAVQRRSLHFSTDFAVTDDAGGDATRLALAAASLGLVIVPNLATLATLAHYPDGATVFVLDQLKPYRLDASNAFTVHPTLVIAASGGGRWFRESKAYVVGNFTLWVQAYSTGFLGFTAGQQLATSSAAADIVITATPFPSPANQRGIVVDNLGNVWLGLNRFDAGVSVRKFNLKDILATGSPTAAVTLEVVAANTEAGYLLFDRYGSLWVPNGTHNTFGVSSFARYSQRSYGVSGTPAPGIITTAFSPGSVGPATSNQQDSVFDSAGNLWTSLAFVETGSNGGIFMLSAAQLAASDTAVVPAKFWSGSNFTATSLGGTAGLAFGPDGKIWSAQYGNGTGTLLRAWDPTQPSGNPAPAITITCTAFAAPYALAFDAAGNLWVGQGGANKLVRLPAASLGASGAVVPDVILTPPGLLLESYIALPNNPDKSGAQLSGVPA